MRMNLNADLDAKYIVNNRTLYIFIGRIISFERDFLFNFVYNIIK